MLLLLLTVVASAGLAVSTHQRATARDAPLPTVIGKKVLGHSVQGRAITAYHLGNPRSRIKAVVLGQMHGDEHAGVIVARSIINGRPITGIDLWVIPTMNPDGDARRTRGNARGVDLNRNWPDIWIPLSGTHYSGSRPLSEPETRALYYFLAGYRPTHLVSLHQPLYGVDTTDGGARNPAFRDRLARNLGLPLKAFRCWWICHGSMTGWLTATQRGAAITVEFGPSPSLTQLTRSAPRAILAAFGATYDSLARHSPITHVDSVRTTGSTVQVAGWAIDPDDRAGQIVVQVREGTTVRWQGTTSVYRADVNRVYGVTGYHGFSARFTAPNGTHGYCVVFGNVGPGLNQKACFTRTVDGSPRAHLDATTSPAPGTARLTGWMFDPDATAASGQVQARVDGIPTGPFAADLPRPDVNTAFGISGSHGFDVTLTGQSAGTHEYCVSALNAGPPAPARELGCVTLAIS